nr:c166.1 [Tranosema rostrale ichnovirus]
MSSQEEASGASLMNIFTQCGPFIPSGAPYNAEEMKKFHEECRRMFSATRKLKATFFNGKQLEIEYNFDAGRIDQDLLLINWHTLQPLFGGNRMPGTEHLSRLSKISDFIENSVHLDKCSFGTRDSCSCGKDSPDKVEMLGDVCGDQHFHHVCSLHVRSWLLRYLEPAILLRESKQLFHELIAKIHQHNPAVMDYYSTADPKNTEVLLEAARTDVDNWSAAGTLE